MVEKIHFRKCVCLIVLICCSISIAYTDDSANKDGEKNSYFGTWDNLLSIAEESIADLLPEEEDSDRIKARRFNTIDIRINNGKHI